MLDVVTESWRLGRPFVSCTVADLEWWIVNDPGQGLDGLASLWLLDGRPVGWEWLDPPGAADWHAQPGVALEHFLDPMLDRLEAMARRASDADATVTATRTRALD